jgi:hypothetical protein
LNTWSTTTGSERNNWTRKKKRYFYTAVIIILNQEFTDYPSGNTHQAKALKSLYSSKSLLIENFKKRKQSSSHNRHDSDRKWKKKRPSNYCKQEYQEMPELTTREHYKNQNDIHMRWFKKESENVWKVEDMGHVKWTRTL